MLLILGTPASSHVRMVSDLVEVLVLAGLVRMTGAGVAQKLCMIYQLNTESLHIILSVISFECLPCIPFKYKVLPNIILHMVEMMLLFLS